MFDLTAYVAESFAAMAQVVVKFYDATWGCE